MGTKKIITDNLDATTLTQFTNTPSSAPTEDYDIANKKYVDDQLGLKSFIKDTDSDTKIQTEESADEDKIRFDTAGVERAVLDNTGFTTSTINGGTNASDNLTLNSTTNATKGKIYFGANSVYDEVNNRFGIMATSPTALLQVGTGTNITKEYGIQIGSEGTINLYRSNNNILKSDAWLYSNLGIIAPVYQANTIYPQSIVDLTLQTRTSGNANIIFKSVGTTPTETMRLDTNGNVGIGQSSPTARTHIKGSTSDNTAYGLKVDDSSNAKNFYVRNDGRIEFKNYAFPTADGTSGQVLTTNGAGTLSFADSGSLLDYGEMYQNDNATATTINTVNVWEEVNNFSSGELNGITVANSDMTITKAGKYHINASISGIPQTANHTFEFAVSVNDSIVTKTKNKRFFSSTSDSGSISLNGILNLSANDVVKLELRNLTTGTNGNFTVQNSNLTLNKI